MDEIMNPVSEEPVEPELQEEKKEVSKPFSLRLGEESVQTFREWCDEQGWNQAEGFAYMVKQLELQQARDLIPNRQKEVENFQSLLTSMTDAFLHSLELNENAENRIRQSLQQQLDTKDQSIADYQESIGKLREKVKELAPLETQLAAAVLEVKNLQVQLEDQKRYLDIAQKTADIMTEKANSYDALLTDKQAIDVALADAKSQLKEKDMELEQQRQLAAERCEKEKSQAIQKEKEAWSEKMDALRDKLQGEKEILQNQLRDEEKSAHQLEQQLRGDILNLNQEINQLKLEKKDLEKDLIDTTNRAISASQKYTNLQKAFEEYKKAHPDAPALQDDPDQLTLDDVTKND